MTRLSKEDIVAAARDLFRDRGYDGFSMGDLATRLGIRKASLYSRFPGKEALAHAALRLTAQELAALRPTPAAQIGPGDWLAAYRADLDQVAAYLRQARRCIGLHFLYGAQDDPLRLATAEFFAALHGQIAAILRRGLGAAQAEALAEESLAALEGATLWLALRDDAAPMARMIDRLVQIAAATAAREDATRAVLARHGGDAQTSSATERALAETIVALQAKTLT